MKRILILIISLFIVSCAIKTGNVKIIDYSKNLAVGKTTKSDIQKDLGTPPRVEKSSSGYEYWEYTYTKGATTPWAFVPGAVHLGAKAMDVENYRLVLKFDGQGILNDYREGKANQPIQLQH